MQFFLVILTTLGSITLLFAITKIIGNKQVSQMNMFDYINGITIGSIAAEMATNLEDFMYPLIAMLVYGAITVLIGIITNKSLKLRRFFSGTSVILFENGKLYRKNFTKARLDINEFLSQGRENGFFNIADIQTAILEPDGKISFMPRVMARPVNPRDLNLQLEQEKPVVNVIVDGVLLANNLKYTGNDKVWLQNQLKASGYSKIEDAFLATVDSNNNLSVYSKINEKASGDIYQ